MEALTGMIFKSLGSTRIMGIVLWFAARMLAPLAAKWGIDPVPVINGLHDILMPLTAYIVGDSAHQAVKAYVAPVPPMEAPPLPENPPV